MPKWNVTDPDGNTLLLEGDSPPTEEELEDIFAQHKPREALTPDTANWAAYGVSKVLPLMEQAAHMTNVGTEVASQLQAEKAWESELEGPFIRDVPDFGDLTNEDAQYRGESVAAWIYRMASLDPQTVQNAWDVIKAGPTFQSQDIGTRDVPPSTGVQIATGVQNLGAGLASIPFDPVNAAAIGASVAVPPLAPWIAGGFAAHMGAHMPELARKAGTASVEGTPYEQTLAYGDVGLNAAFIPQLGAHAVRGVGYQAPRILERGREFGPGGRDLKTARLKREAWMQEHEEVNARIEVMENDPNADPKELASLKQYRRNMDLLPEHQQFLQSQLGKTPFKIVWDKPGRRPDQYAGPSPGGVEVYGETIPDWMEQVGKQRRAGVFQSVLSEEKIHRFTTPEESRKYWESLTDYEKRQVEKIYGHKAGSPDYSIEDLGAEAIRQRLQREMGQTPRDIAEEGFEKRLDLKWEELKGRISRRVREENQTEASNRGLEALRSVRERIKQADKGEEGATVDELWDPSASLKDKDLPELIKGERLVTIQRPDGTTYRASFGDQHWELGDKKIPSIGKPVEGKWSHTMLGPGEKIIEDAAPAASLKPRVKDAFDKVHATFVKDKEGHQASFRSTQEEGEVLENAIGTEWTKENTFEALMRLAKLSTEQVHQMVAEGFASDASIRAAAEFVQELRSAGLAPQLEALKGYVRTRLGGGEETAFAAASRKRSRELPKGVEVTVFKERRGELQDQPWHQGQQALDAIFDDHAEMQHEWYDVLPWEQRDIIDRNLTRAEYTARRDMMARGFDDDMINKAWEYIRMGQEIERMSQSQQYDPPTPGHHWSDITSHGAKFSEEHGYFEMAVHLPLEVKPEVPEVRKEVGRDLFGEPIYVPISPKATRQIHGKYFAAQHEPFPDDTIVHGRGWYASGAELAQWNTWLKDRIKPTDKVLVVEEIQSDWLNHFKRFTPLEPVEGLTTPSSPPSHPLLEHANSIGMSAMLEQAKNAGADWIVVVDGKTSMMSQTLARPDLGVERTFKTPEEAQHFVNELTRNGYLHPKTKVDGRTGETTVSLARRASGVGIENLTGADVAQLRNRYGMAIPREAGHIQAYDKALPTILEQMTGNPETWVSLGKHQHGPSDELANQVGQPKVNATGHLFKTEIETRPAASFKDRKAADRAKLLAMRLAAEQGQQQPGLKVPSMQPQYPAVQPSERVGATESGALPRPKPEDYLAGPIEPKPLSRARKPTGATKELPGELSKGLGAPRVYYDRPTYRGFRETFPSVPEEQLQQLWTEYVDREIDSASNERLQEWLKGLNLVRNFGRFIRGAAEEPAPAARPLAGQLEMPTEAIPEEVRRDQAEALRRQATDLEALSARAPTRSELPAGPLATRAPAVEPEIPGLGIGEVKPGAEKLQSAKYSRRKTESLELKQRRTQEDILQKARALRAEADVIEAGGQPALSQGIAGPARSLPSRHRERVQNAIKERLKAEAYGAKRSQEVLRRGEITADDLDYENKKTEYGAYTELNKHDVEHLEVLNQYLRDQARGSARDPETATRRVVAVVGKDGRVHVLSTYNDNGVQRVVEPTGGLAGKLHRPLDAAFLRNYRPFATMLLRDPIQALNQQYRSVSSFMDMFGEEARGRSQEAGRVAPQPNYQSTIEGPEGLEGEGGGFTGPNADIARAAAGERQPEKLVRGPLSEEDIAGIRDHIIDKFGDWESVEDVKQSIDAITKRAAARQLKPVDWRAIQGYTKIFDAIDRAFPNLPESQIIDMMVSRLYDNYKNAETPEGFIRRTMAQHEGEGGKAVRPVQVGEAAPTGRELTARTVRQPIVGATGPYGRSVARQAADIARRGALAIPEPERLTPAEAEHVATRPWQPANPEIARAAERASGKGVEPAEPGERLTRSSRAQEEAISEVKAEEEWQHYQSPAASLKRKDILPKVTKILGNFGSTYDEWIVDRLERKGGDISKLAAGEFRQVVDRSKELYGSLTPVLDPARKAAGGQREVSIPGVSRLIGKVDLPTPEAMKAVTWLHRKKLVTPATATRNTVGALENTISVPSFAQRLVSLAQVANLAIGKLLEPVVKGFKAGGSFARNVTATGYDIIRQGQGEGWLNWTAGIARANQGRPAQMVGGKVLRPARKGMRISQVRDFFREWKETLDKPGVDMATIERVNQDFIRKFPNVVTDVKIGGVWHPVVHADLFNYLENAAQRAAHIRAFREAFPIGRPGVRTKAGRASLAELIRLVKLEIRKKGKKQNLIDALDKLELRLTETQQPSVGQSRLDDLMEALRVELEPREQADVDALVRTLQGHPADNYASWGMLSPVHRPGQAFRMANQTVGNLLARMVLTGQMGVQAGETMFGGAPMFGGAKNYIRGLARLRQIYAELEKQGMVSRVIYDFSFDPNAPIRSSFRMAGNALSKVFMEQFLNEVQEGGAAAMARVIRERIEQGTLTDWEQRNLPETFRDMGFDKTEASAMMLGDPALLSQFERKAAAWLTSGNKALSESSRIGMRGLQPMVPGRLFHSIFRFQTYPMMKAQQFRRVLTRVAETFDKGTPEERLAATEKLVRFMFYNTMQGAVTAAVMALLYNGWTGAKIKTAEAEDEPLRFILDSFMASMGGPLYLLMQGGGGKGLVGLGEQGMRMVFPWSVWTEISDMANGLGKYKDLDTFDRIGKFIESKTPGARIIGTGLATVGLSLEDRKLDAAMMAFYRWRREKLGFREQREYLLVDEEKKFRMAMQEAVKAIKRGDQEGFRDAYLKASGVAKGGTASEVRQNIANSFRSRKKLKGPNGGNLTEEQKTALREHIGFDAYDRLIYYDLMLDEAAKGVLLPPMD